MAEHNMPQMKKKSFLQKNGLIAVWSMAGIVAVGYIGFLVSDAGRLENGKQLAANGQGAATETKPVQRQVAALTQRIDDLNKREKQNARKISDIEQSLGPMTSALPEPASEQTVNPKNGAQHHSGYGIDEVELVPAHKVTPQPRVRPRLASVDPAKPDKQAAPEPKPRQDKVSISVIPLTETDALSALPSGNAGDEFGIKLARALTISSLERHWDYLSRSHEGVLLKGLTPHFILDETDSPNRYNRYNLIAGPVSSLRRAETLCRQFALKNIDCEETSYQQSAGEKLQTAKKQD